MTSSPATFADVGVEIVGSSLVFHDPENLSWEDIEQVGGMLGHLGVIYPFLVGDLILMVEKIHGENSPEASQLETLFPHTQHTLDNYRWVSWKIPPHRRRKGLGFGVHEAVAALEPDMRDHWLDIAEAQQWKREEARGAIRAARERGDLPQRSVPQPELSPESETAAPSGESHICPTCGQPWKEEER